MVFWGVMGEELPPTSWLGLGKPSSGKAGAPQAEVILQAPVATSPCTTPLALEGRCGCILMAQQLQLWLR